MRIPEIHELKVWLKYFLEIENNTKPFELRKNDRNYQKGDFLSLNPYDEIEQKEIIGKGRNVAKVTYMLSDAENFGLKKGYVILGLKFWKDFTNEERLLFRLVEAGKITPGEPW